MRQRQRLKISMSEQRSVCRTFCTGLPGLRSRRPASSCSGSERPAAPRSPSAPSRARLGPRPSTSCGCPTTASRTGRGTCTAPSPTRAASPGRPARRRCTGSLLASPSSPSVRMCSGSSAPPPCRGIRPWGTNPSAPEESAFRECVPLPVRLTLGGPYPQSVVGVGCCTGEERKRGLLRQQPV